MANISTDAQNNGVDTVTNIYGSSNRAEALVQYSRRRPPPKPPKQRHPFGIWRSLVLILAGFALALSALAGTAMATGMAPALVGVVQQHIHPATAAPAHARPARPAQSSQPPSASPAPVVVPRPLGQARFAADMAAAGVVADPGWAQAAGTQACAAWAHGQTTSQVDAALVADGLEPGHEAAFTAAAKRDLCPAAGQS